MPIYEYRCEECNNKFEVMQSFRDAPIRTCPKCGGSVKKLISNSSFHLKGSGWYLTDHAKKSSPKDEKPSKKKSEAKTETKTESTSTSDSSAKKK
jgi:putative FmdB family regulatory protein